MTLSFEENFYYVKERASMTNLITQSGIIEFIILRRYFLDGYLFSL